MNDYDYESVGAIEPQQVEVNKTELVIPIEAEKYDEVVIQPLVDDSLTVNLRLNFVRKVFSILSFQLLFTTVLTIIVVTNEVVSQMVLDYGRIPFNMSLITIFIVLIILFCCKGTSKKVPGNFILLSIFTVCLAYIIAVICLIVCMEYSNGAQLILVALAMTCATTFGLTFYACQMKTDFTCCGKRYFQSVGVLKFLCVICLLFSSILMVFFEGTFLQILVCLFGLVIYSIYIICDTYFIMDGGRYGRYGLNLDDYILGSVILYLDIIYLFLKLLQLLLMIFGKKS